MAASTSAAKAKVPSLDHLTFKDFEELYEPADDTYLLLDALQGELALLKAWKPCCCIELGPGSGVVSTFLSGLLERAFADGPASLPQQSSSSAAFPVTLPSGAAPAAAGEQFSGLPVLAIDLNGAAAAATVGTAAANARCVDVVNGDKWSCLRPSLQGGVDMVVFNPPYVPTPDEEVGSQGVEAAWAGGERGRVVIDQVLPTLHSLLSPTGAMYMVAVLENDPADIARQLAKLGFCTVQVAKRRAFNEVLFILKVRRDTPGAAAVHAAAEAGMPALAPA